MHRVATVILTKKYRCVAGIDVITDIVNWLGGDMLKED